MNAPTHEKQRFNLEGIFSVQSSKLKELRVAVRSWKESSAIIGSAAQFRLVVDANIILGDLIWLVSKRTNDSAKTQLMETIEAETIDIYAPPIFFDEVEEKIPLLATEKGLDINLMYEHWEIYKTKIKLSLPDSDKVQVLRGGKDPDDAEYIALEQTMGASGVISKNHDIRQMGGNQISITCITHLRNYSRSTSIELNIKVNGVMFANISVASIRGLFEGGKALINGIGKAPDWVKLALLAGGLFVVLHPGARTAVANSLKTVLQGIGEATPTIIALIAEAAVLAEKHKSEAQVHLDNAMKELERNNSAEILQHSSPISIKAERAEIGNNVASPRRTKKVSA